MQAMYWMERLDWAMLTALFCLGLLSVALLYPYSFLQEGDFALRQGLFFTIGIGLTIALSRLNVSFFKKKSEVIVGVYFLGIFLLCLVLFLGITIRGAASWVSILTIGFQPSEFIKVILIFLLARYFTHRHVQMYRIRNVVLSFLYAALPLALVLVQPDLGSTIIIFFLWLGIVVMAGMKWRHLAVVFFALVLIAAVFWTFLLLPYQKVRILSFLDPSKDPLGANYSRNQSLIAIGAGGLWGKGIGNNTHSLYGFLPEAHTDFAFAMLAESLGLTGAVIFFILLGIICMQLLRFKGKSNFDRLFSSGLAFLIFLQSSVNISINLGMLPVTGLTLPFLSYGGSSIISLCMGLGIYQALYARV